MIEWYATEGWMYLYAFIGVVVVRLLVFLSGRTPDGPGSMFDLDGDCGD